jgi:hypothetical protein
MATVTISPKSGTPRPFYASTSKLVSRSNLGVIFLPDLKILAMDQLCPMKEVSACITAENIFVNKQLGIGPALMFWDFAVKKYWKPFLLL